MNDGEAVVFVEVRFRSNDRHGSGLDTITRRKQLRLDRAARYFLARNPYLSQNPCRFDVISVGKGKQDSRFTWVRNAFESAQG